jgi:uncharacterized coiled-coil DUF342 family protein
VNDRLSEEEDILENIKSIRNKETIENQAKKYHNMVVMLVGKIAELKKESSSYKDKYNKKKAALKELKDAHFNLKESYNSIVKVKDRVKKKLNANVFDELRIRNVDVRMLEVK